VAWLSHGTLVFFVNASYCAQFFFDEKKVGKDWCLQRSINGGGYQARARAGTLTVFT
jgi:hypothetical protein